MTADLESPFQSGTDHDNGAQKPMGVMPDFHHLTSHSAVALESYMHLYLDSDALAESLFKSSVEHH